MRRGGTPGHPAGKAGTRNEDRAQLAESRRAEGAVSWKCSNTSGKLGPSAANGPQLRGRLQLPGRKLRPWQAGRLPAWRPPSVLPRRAAARGGGATLRFRFRRPLWPGARALKGQVPFRSAVPKLSCAGLGWAELSLPGKLHRKTHLKPTPQRLTQQI